MGFRHQARLFFTAFLLALAIAVPSLAEPQAKPRRDNGGKSGQIRRGFDKALQDGRTEPPRRLATGYQEPAYARGYADGRREGVRDARERDRYDPVGTRDYRNADQGYNSSYGSRDAYKNNYRAGFRQGYEEGYRSGR